MITAMLAFVCRLFSFFILAVLICAPSKGESGVFLSVFLMTLGWECANYLNRITKERP